MTEEKDNAIIELPIVSITKTKMISDLEVENTTLTVKGRSVQECLTGIKKLKDIAKKV